MMRPLSRFLAILIGLVVPITTAGVRMVSSQGAPSLASQSSSLEQLFKTPPDDSRIMMRWWWFGPSITRDDIDAEMRQMKDAGIGGFEVAGVYAMAIDDPARHIQNAAYLSPQFLDNIHYASLRARELGLRMDVTLGSGWPFGGPHITPELASRKLRTDRREIAPSVAHVARPIPYEHEQLIAAFIGRGSGREADPESFVQLDLTGTGPLSLPPGDGPRTLLFYFSAPTGQTVKRAAVGAEGYVLDHYNRAAIETHLREVGDKLIAAAGPGGIHAVFCDSLEVYDADWTRDMPAEFQKRRGYALTPLLPLLDYNAGDRSRRVRIDVGRTLTELYEERFLTPIREWSRAHGVLFRIQGYGQPPAALSSYRLADLMDGEGFEWRTLSRTRWAASAAHLLGQPVVGSETWTWIHSPAFRATPLDLKGEAHQHFLSGVNQLIGHGWPYSPPQVARPGWPFYAAGALNDKNPWWPVMPDLALYLQRISFLLRQGEPVSDVAVYAPTDDARAAARAGTADYLNLWMGVHDRLGPSLVPAILAAGASFDLIDDGTLAEASRRKYSAIVVPASQSIPEPTRKWLTDAGRSGAKVISVAASASDHEIAAQLASALEPDVRITPSTADLGFVHRHLRDADIYFLANTGNIPHDVSVRFRAGAHAPELWDPMTGGVAQLRLSGDGVALHFDAYAANIVVFRPAAGAAPAPPRRSIVATTSLSSGWTIGAGAVTRQAATLPFSWNDVAEARYFSGTATYRRTFDRPAESRGAGARTYIDFGDAAPIEREPLPDGTLRGNSFAALVAAPIREAATVSVNGRKAGTLWAPPYRIDITELLKDGSNDLAVEVYNTAINQLAEGGRLPDVEAVTARYGRRFRLQDMDTIRPLPSGILSVPELVVER